MPPRRPEPVFRIEYPPELPISARVDEIVTAIQQNQVVVLAGETGSGKTTQIPKMCLAAGSGRRGRIACTQPRRVAATSVARRVAEELNVELGREVGCKIRFADQTSAATIIKFMTDGMLLAELQSDPLLREYDTIIVDEAHERSLNIDFILGHLRRLRSRRPELKIVITSATIDTAAFSAAFDQAPVIEVSGRVYPVEVIYAPLDELPEDGAEPTEAGKKPPPAPAGRKPARDDEYTYLDAAVEATERVLRESAQGDVLVFLPTERDIREAGDLLDGRRLGGIEVVPLFGRLTNAEQQRVFAPTTARKVVLATNIAETSLTIPGIRFVVDTGLARISRYVPQSRTRRLPVEPVAQSSADQRKGRCGRVSDGVCIRLYSEQDFNDRPRFTQPEIQRSNLADVILRMKAFGLGDIEEFPFLNAPPAKGIRSGYALLHELGALDDAGTLTDLGRDLAHLPVDPTLGRMVLQASTERALREVLIIASALSIQDPRERPLDQQAKADAAHRRFSHPDSDFLTLLAIWEAYHDEFERMTLGKLRKFCTAHFLSFTRMREWRDVHAQLVETVETREGFADTSVYDGLPAGAGETSRTGRETAAARPPSGRKSRKPIAPEDVHDMRVGTPAYRAIHRSILAGLLGNVATLADDGVYHATHDRKVGVFPGSVLFERTASGRKPSFAKAAEGAMAGPKRPTRWLMAAEIMETGRLYARTCARIDPQWAVDLAPHLLRESHTEPFWDERAGRVLVKQRRRLYNLELDLRTVGYGRINPAHATELFIREGLVGDTITWPFDFLANNRRLREKTEAVLTRTRSAGYMNIDEAVYRFYAARLMPEVSDVAGAVGPGPGSTPPATTAATGDTSSPAGVSSVADLIDLVRHRQAREPKFLFLTEDDLRTDEAPDAEAFPEALPVENRVLPLSYAYKPGQDDDGVTLRVSVAEADALTDAALDWAVPGHLPEKIELMLKALPKEQRRALIPLAETAAAIAGEIGLIAGRRPQPTLAAALAELLTDRLGVRIDPATWAGKELPSHLRVRVEVVDGKGRPVAAGRELAEVQAGLAGRQREVSQAAARDDSTAWKRAREQWEKPPATEWVFGDLPASVPVAEHGGVPVQAFPGLQKTAGGVAVRLFASAGQAAAATREGAAELLGSQLRFDLGWLEKDLRDLRALGPLAVTLAPLESLQQQAFASIRRWACGRAWQPLTTEAFGRELAAAKADLRGLVPKLADWLREILTLRLALQTHKTPYPGLEGDLAALLPRDFVERTPFARLPQLPRYLKAMQLRADRWRRDPAKDAQRARELQPFAQAVARLGAKAGEFRWLVEEFRVSLFAQELGTAEPVSAVRLERALKDLAAGETGTGAATPTARVALPLPVKGKTVLKSLDALGRLNR